ncbi:hypothetical protein C7271_03625 [filamentous cyanobacterium CCP5]|nr:hypothetical protein C7271_03625 [filamentous cyanobacterium CCP5]
MRKVEPAALRELAADIETELARLHRLEQEIAEVQGAIAANSKQAHLFYENLALKLHNFYTGCEKILRLVAVELNGGLPAGADWHKRLLERMGQAREGRPAVLKPSTMKDLREFLGFRHIVRNLYGFELEAQRVAALVERYPLVWDAVRRDVEGFVGWLRSLATELSS